MPGDNVLPLQQEGCRPARAAQFANKHLWVTRYEPREMYAAATTRTSTPAAMGCRSTRRPNRTHGERGHRRLVLLRRPPMSCRPEDWPVMPVEYAGFMLKPVGFFAGNPAMDLPARSQPRKPRQSRPQDLCCS